MKAIIAGAGIAGLSAANFLAARDWSVTVLERADGPRQEGYMIDFFGPGFDAAGELGVLPRLRELGYPVARLDYVDAKGRSRAHLDVGSFASMMDGNLVSILRPDLELALREALPPTVEPVFSATVTAVEQRADRVRVGLADGRQLEGDLLIGADGIHSQTRAVVFGPEADYFTFLGFHVGAFRFHDARADAVPANHYTATDTKDRALFFYRLRDGSVSVLDVHRTDTIDRPANPQAEFRHRYRDLGDLAGPALEHCPERFYYDQVAQIRMPAWHRGRVVLLGDAAAAVSLLGGQGASLAMAGALALAEELDRQRDVPAALDAFEVRWRPVVAEHQRAGRAAASWFVPANRRGLWMRRMFLRLIRVPGFSHLVSRTVLGRGGTAL
jgi:2-polyprenyl-6-methoxyphenol hydroxylase-like FAD-dependent oxidoreductase